MRPGQNRRMRGRNRNNGGGGNNNSKGPNPLTRSYESNGPDVKVRGNAQTIAEKYMQLARDAMSSGDPVGAESYYQHAEHYVRIVLAAHEQLRQQYGENYRPQRPFGLQDQDDDDDEAEEAAEATVQPARRGEGDQPDIAGDDDDALLADEMPARPMRDPGEPRPRFNDQRGEGRQQDGRRFDRDRQGGERQGGERQGGERQGGDRNGGDRVNGERRFDRDRNERQDRDRGDRGERHQRGEGRGEGRGERRFDRPRDEGRRDDYRRDDNRRDETRREESTAGGADDVGALPAFLMTPTRTVSAEPARTEAPRVEPVIEAVVATPPAPSDEAPAAPAPKRRGRPPRKREEGVAEAPGE